MPYVKPSKRAARTKCGDFGEAEKLNVISTMEELTAAFPFRSFGRPHIAQLMVKKVMYLR